MLADILHKIAGMDAEGERAYAARMSSAGPDRCMRQMTYHAMGHTPDRQRGDRMWHVLDDSSWHEELSGDWIGKSAYQLHSRQLEVSIPKALTWMPDTMVTCPTCKKPVHAQSLHGHIDGIITDMLGKDRLFEHKALNHFTFEKYWKGEEFPEDYFAQVACYLRALLSLLPDINECVMLVKNKNTSGFLEYVMRYDSAHDTLHILSLTRHTGDTKPLNEVRPNITNAAIRKFQSVAEHATEQTLPDRPYEPSDWHCEYCPYVNTCWDSFLGEVKAYDAQVDLPSDIETTARYYKEVSASIKDQEAEKNKLAHELVTIMVRSEAKRGIVGPYTITLVTQNRSVLDMTAVPLQLQQALERYKKVSPSRFVRVTKSKSEDEQ